MESHLLDAALDLIKAEIPVFPTQNKVPSIAGGFTKATLDKNQARVWWESMESLPPDAGIGIVTGQASGLVVLDIDVTKGGDDSEKALVETYGAIPNTCAVRTQSGGRHYYFQAPKVPLRCKIGILPGVDFKADGGYVIAPPSKQGAYYYTNEELPAPCPEWLIKLVSDPVKKEPERNEAGLIANGNRNNYLTQVAGKLQRSGLLTFESLDAINQRDLEFPLDEKELTIIVNSVMRYLPDEQIEVDEPLTVSAGELVEPMLAYISDKARVKGQSTGIAGLDRVLGGGFREKELVFLSATAKTGKSSLLIQLIYNLLEQNIPVGFASVEMEAASEILPSLLSIKFSENTWKEETTIERSVRYKKQLQQWPLYFLGRYGTTPLTKFQEWVKDCKQKNVRFFFADHLHFLAENSEKFELVAEYARGLKKLTITENIFLLLVVQPSQIADGQELNMMKLRGGSSLSQVMNSLLIMQRYRNPDTNKLAPNISCLKLDASRSKLARPGEIFLQYDSETTAFTEVDKIEAGPVYEKP